MGLRDLVSGYYGAGGLTEAVLDALSSAGVEIDKLQPSDIFPVGQLHAGGAGAAEHLIAKLDLGPGLRLLDVGSGICEGYANRCWRTLVNLDTEGEPDGQTDPSRS